MSSERIRYLAYLRFDQLRSVLVNAQNVLQIFLDISSPHPQVPGQVSCFADALEEFGFFDDDSLSELERRQHLCDWLLDKVLTFYVKTHKSAGKTYYLAEGIFVHEIDADEFNSWEYEVLPVIDTEGMTAAAVEEAFRKGHPLKGFVPPPRFSNKSPLLLLVGGEFRGPFDKPIPGSGRYGVKAKGAQAARMPAIADGTRIIDDGDVWFVEKQHYQTLVLEMEFMKPEEQAKRTVVEDERPVPGETLPPPIRPAEPVIPPPPEPAPSTEAAAPFLYEDQFLAALRRESEVQGLYFRDDELLNVHTALKTGSLVVLAGLSGTGKSRLVEVYRRALGLGAHNFLWLSVRPNWNDDADLIGYYDPMNKLYRPGETGLVDLLRRAHKQPDELFMVCFDEMNLARVEHYFAQFLSILERPDDERELRLYSPEIAGTVTNALDYPPAIPLGPNVLFCGTINMDESTHSFSDKVLDRANIIAMDHVDILQWWERLKQGAPAAGAPAGRPATTISAGNWKRWFGEFDARPYGTQVHFLQQLNEALAKAGPERRFGYRVVRQILLYLQRVPRDRSGAPLLSMADALDQQVAQRVLSKVRGSGAELRELLGPEGALLKVLGGASEIGPFVRSRAEVARKHREMENHDFTA